MSLLDNLDMQQHQSDNKMENTLYQEECSELLMNGTNEFLSAEEEHFGSLEDDFLISKDVDNLCRTAPRSPRKSILALFDPLFRSSPAQINQAIISDISENSENNSLTYDNDYIINDLEEASEHLDEFVETIVDNIIFRVISHQELLDEQHPVVDLTEEIPEETKMENINETMVIHDDENADLKLQLNACQQVRATLELQLRQKEEIIIKTQAELARQDQFYKKEIISLKEKLEEKPAEIVDVSQTKELQASVKQLKSQITSENNAHREETNNYKKIFEGYENTLAKRLADWNTLNNEHEAVKRHLANLELAFSDVHQKYERCKKIIEGYKSNEETLKENFTTAQENLIKSEEKYESLKAHAKAQIEKCNQEIQILREEYEGEINKLNGVNKRLKIKNDSLADLLDQKTKECTALAALCDEVTGKV